MKLFIILNLLLLTKRAPGESGGDSPNVKTVLFKESDLNKNCWNQRETSLLVIRKAMQDLIPKRIPTSKTMPQLMAYLRSVEETVDEFPPEDETNILIRLAVADVLGGYLQSIVVPLAKQGYYSGTVDYDTVSSLHDMMDDMKLKLGTDGGGWPHAIDPRTFGEQVATLDLEGSMSAACSALVVLDVCPLNGSRISIPYFDDNNRPTAVALPLKIRNLYPLKHASSSNVLLKYYTFSMMCLKNFTDTDVVNFNLKYHKWITEKLYPHLHDEDGWYAGFTGVLRILETMKQRGLTSAVYPAPARSGNITDLEKSLKTYPCGGAAAARDSYIFYIFLLLLFLLLLLLLCVYCCFIYGIKKSKNKSKKKSEDSDLDPTLVSLFCGVKNVNETTKCADEYKENEGHVRGSSLFSRNESDFEKREYSSVAEETKHRKVPMTSPYSISLDRSETDNYDDESTESDISS